MRDMFVSAAAILFAVTMNLAILSPQPVVNAELIAAAIA